MNDKWCFWRKCIFAGVPKTTSRRTPLFAFLFFVTFSFILIWSPGMPPEVLQEFQDAEKTKEMPQPFSTHPVFPTHLMHRTLNFDPALHSNDYNLLIDLTEFDFVINHYPCNESTNLKRNSSKLVLLVLVHSDPANWEKRQVIRETWGSWANMPVEGVQINLLFLLGEVSSKSLQERIYEEDQNTEDIVQGRFLDSYRNLTYKHVMGLKWSTYFCPRATYVLKTDDDVFVNTPAFVNFLTVPRQGSNLKPRTNRFILCNRIDKARVKRSYRSKWHVSPQEYPRSEYPSYCSGCVILYSFDVVTQLYQRAQVTPYFWVDDVHVTGTLAAQLNLIQTDVGDLMLKESEGFIVSSLYPGRESESWWWSVENIPPRQDKDTFLFGKELESSVIRNLWREVNDGYKQ